MEESETVSPEQQNQLLFMQLVTMFHDAAFQHMGKVMNPVTQKVERDLDQAKHAIDILGMLEEKTRGNLQEDEKRLIDHTLYELRMNYLDEANKEEGAEKADVEGEKGEEAEPESRGNREKGEEKADAPGTEEKEN